ncbi:MAG: MATE family efflux transporter [Crocinitomicaceae bacterium]|nr:MATE family efflux transporter [Crocinitomicaceae bacterium]
MISAKEINKLALPAILFNITEPIIGLTDIAIIGQMNENATQAQGGVGLSAGLIATLIWGFAQMRTSLSAIISRHFGSNQLEKVKTLIPQTFILTLIIGLVIAISISYYYESIAHFLYGNINIITYHFSKEYFTVRSIGIPISLLIALAFGVFRGFQNTSWAMYISLFGGAINIILDFVLVLGVNNIIEPMGVRGAAWASVISQIFMLMCAIYCMYKYTPFYLKLNKKISPYFKEMILIFTNMFIRTMVLNIVFILSNRFANQYGKEQLAAYTIAYNIWIFTSFFIDGYSNAGNALAGKFLGEKDNQKLAFLGKKLLQINMKIVLILMTVYAIGYFHIGLLFNKDLQVNALFASTFWIVIVAQPFNCIAFTFDGLFKGLGRAVELRNTLIQATFLVFIPILYILDFINLGLYSVWTALTAWMIYRGFSLFIKFKKITS